MNCDQLIENARKFKAHRELGDNCMFKIQQLPDRYLYDRQKLLKTWCKYNKERGEDACFRDFVNWLKYSMPSEYMDTLYIMHSINYRVGKWQSSIGEMDKEELGKYIWLMQELNTLVYHQFTATTYTDIPLMDMARKRYEELGGDDDEEEDDE